MNVSALVWGLLWTGLGAVVGLGVVPGSDGWAMGPRIGVAALLVMLGLTVITVGNAQWFLRKTTRAKDYEGGCPVGTRCACGTFNMRPRGACKDCGAALQQ